MLHTSLLVTVHFQVKTINMCNKLGYKETGEEVLMPSQKLLMFSYLYLLLLVVSTGSSLPLFKQ